MFHIFQKHSFVIIIMTWEYFEKLKDKICNAQNRRSGEIANTLFELYKSSVMTLTSFFFFWHSLQQHWKILLHFIGEVDHLISLLFYEQYFLVLWFIGKWGWRKIRIIFFYLMIFGWWFNGRCFSVFIWPRESYDKF